MPKVTRVIQVRRAPRGIPAIPAPRARKDLKARQVPRESVVPRVTPEMLERKVQKATQVTQVPRDLKATKVNLGPRILRV